jgi:ssDNA-binding Zn-finger/Zn-ribbon topoisomerase 1
VSEPTETNAEPAAAPLCPECSVPMALRTSEFGPFWGCSQFPRCRGRRNPDGSAKEPGVTPVTDEDKRRDLAKRLQAIGQKPRKGIGHE